MSAPYQASKAVSTKYINYMYGWFSQMIAIIYTEGTDMLPVLTSEPHVCKPRYNIP